MNLKPLRVACFVVCAASASDIPPERMQAIYEEVKTPYKYGIVIPAPEGKKVDLRVKQLDQGLLARLSAELTPEQVDQVKNGMTDGVVQATYNAYLARQPELTEPQKQKIMEFLVEARELAMDCGSSKEKHGIFRKYMGRINNYLVAEGYTLE